MATRNTLKSLIVDILSKSKTGMVNAQIAQAVLKRRPSTGLSYIDSTLTAASKAGVIQKTPTNGTQGKSKFVYSVEAQPSVRKIILEALNGRDRVDHQEILSIVRSVRPGATYTNVGSTLYQMAKRGEVLKSKTLMTDNNVTSDASKFVYTGIKSAK